MRDHEKPPTQNGDIYEREEDEKFLEPLTYFMKVPAKEQMEILIKAFNYWLAIPEDKLTLIGKTVLTIYDSVTLIDDIEDQSAIRRGIPCAHTIYGIGRTINAANLATFLSVQRLLNLDNLEILKIYNEQSLNFLRGEAMEMYWRENFICPTEEEYETMARRKLDGLFNMMIGMFQVFSDRKDDFLRLSELLGSCYQICDDYRNLQSEDYMEDKSYCEDFSEGKFSFPIIHAIRSRPDDDRVLNILKQRTKDDDVKKYAVSLLEEFGSFEYTRDVLKKLRLEVVEEVRKLGGNPYLEEVLTMVFEFGN